MATYTEGTMHPETRRMLPDLGIERALGLRDAERTLLRYKLMRLGTKLLDLDIEIMRAERGSRDPTEGELRDLRTRFAERCAPGADVRALRPGRPIAIVR
jgi:hypothetical protein